MIQNLFYKQSHTIYLYNVFGQFGHVLWGTEKAVEGLN